MLFCSNVSSSITEIASCLSVSKDLSLNSIALMPAELNELSRLLRVNSKPSFITFISSESSHEMTALSKLSLTDRNSLAKASTPNNLALVTS